MTEIRVFPHIDALALAGARCFVDHAAKAIATTGHFSVALAGGSTPRPLYRLLASDRFAGQVDWRNVHVFWGDERTVPPTHADSNYRMARETLLDLVPESNIHRMQGDRPPQEAARHYESDLRAFFSEQDWPRFDLVLLGMGDDGHTASLFPATAALDEDERWVVANYVDQHATWRLTLSVPAINAAAFILFLVSGENKAAALQHVHFGEHRPHQFPSQLIQPQAGRLLWLVDKAAMLGPEQ